MLAGTLLSPVAAHSSQWLPRQLCMRLLSLVLRQCTCLCWGKLCLRTSAHVLCFVRHGSHALESGVVAAVADAVRGALLSTVPGADPTIDLYRCTVSVVRPSDGVRMYVLPWWVEVPPMSDSHCLLCCSTIGWSLAHLYASYVAVVVAGRLQAPSGQAETLNLPATPSDKDSLQDQLRSCLASALGANATVLAAGSQ